MPSVSSSLRASPWEWVQTVLLAVNLAWTTLYMGGYRPEAQLVTLMLTTALLLVHFGGKVFAGEAAGVAVHPAGWWLLPFVTYAAANVIWVTPARWLGWLDWLNWAQMATVFWVVLNGIRAPATRRAVWFVLAALAVIGVLLGCYQRFVRPDWVIIGPERAAQFIGRASGSFSIPNSLAAWLLLLLPAAGAVALRKRAHPVERVWAGWLVAVMAFGLVLTLSRGGWLALLVALALWPLTRRRWSWKRRAAVTIAVIAVAALGGLWVHRASSQVRGRIANLVRDSGERTRPLMWRGAWALFRESPFVGTGAGSYNIAFERHRPEGFPDTPLWAHNEYLNTLSDYGGVGFALFFGAAALIAARCVFGRRAEREVRAGWVDSDLFTAGLGVGLLAFSLQLVVDFHFKIPALALAFATVAALAVGNRWNATSKASASTQGGRSHGRSRLLVGSVFLGGAVAILALVALIFVPLLRSEARRVPARRAIDRLAEEAFDLARYRAVIPAAQRALAAATEAFPANGQAWADLSYATALLPFVEPDRTAALGAEAERYADRALACSQAQPEFWIRRGVARDLQGRWAEAGTAFARATALAPASANAWFYYADHLSRVAAAREAAEAAVAFCLRLDPGNTLGIALRQRLALESSTR